jgi:hypothetical protein
MWPDDPMGVDLARIFGLRLAWIVLIVIALGCAGPRDVTVPSAGSPEVQGTWRGTFWQVNAGDTGYIHGDLSVDFKEDGSYTGTWTTYVVAGSSRGATSQVAGRFVVAGDRVTLTDWRDLVLRRAGDTLYGLTVDPGSGRTIQVRLGRTSGP